MGGTPTSSTGFGSLTFVKAEKISDSWLVQMDVHLHRNPENTENSARLLAISPPQINMIVTDADTLAEVNNREVTCSPRRRVRATGMIGAWSMPGNLAMDEEGRRV